MAKTIADLTLIETVGNQLSGDFYYREVDSKKSLERDKITVLNYPPMSFNIEGFTHTMGMSDQIQRLQKLIKSEYKNIPAPSEANALLLGGSFEHWENNLTFPASYCQVKL